MRLSRDRASPPCLASKGRRRRRYRVNRRGGPPGARRRPPRKTRVGLREISLDRLLHQIGPVRVDAEAAAASRGSSRRCPALAEQRSDSSPGRNPAVRRRSPERPGRARPGPGSRRRRSPRRRENPERPSRAAGGDPQAGREELGIIPGGGAGHRLQHGDRRVPASGPARGRAASPARGERRQGQQESTIAKRAAAARRLAVRGLSRPKESPQSGGEAPFAVFPFDPGLAGLLPGIRDLQRRRHFPGARGAAARFFLEQLIDQGGKLRRNRRIHLPQGACRWVQIRVIVFSAELPSKGDLRSASRTGEAEEKRSERASRGMARACSGDIARNVPITAVLGQEVSPSSRSARPSRGSGPPLRGDHHVSGFRSGG